MAHGEFGKWLESIGMNWDVANRMMKVASEIGSNSDTYRNLGLNALYLIATLPPDQRDQPHVIPSTGEIKTVDEMTVRELREVKKALKEAERRAEQAERSEEIVRKRLEGIGINKRMIAEVFEECKRLSRPKSF